MKILNTYFGLEAHNFNAEPYHACVRYDVSEEEIQFQKNKAKQSLTNRKCFWYLVEVVEINPHTGEHKSEGFFDTVGEKAKIVLNAPAKKPTKAPVDPTPTLNAFIAAMANGKTPTTTMIIDNPWNLGMVGNIVDHPAPLQETELPF